MSNSISIYDPQVRALALREGMGELQAWRQINDREKVRALMSEQRQRQISQGLAAMRAAPRRQSAWERLTAFIFRDMEENSDWRHY